LWPERVVARLSPAGVGLSRLGWRGKLRSTASTEAAPPAAGEPPWVPAVRLLSAMVAAGEFRHDLLDVMVSSQFARFAVAPGSRALKGVAEEGAHARQCFTAIHGDGEGWTLRSGDRDPRRARLVCGIESALVAGIGAAVRPLRWRARRLRPLMAAAFDRECWRIGSPTVWLACIETDVICLGLVVDGQWRDVRCEPFEGDWRYALPALLARAALLADWDGDCDRVHVIASPDAHRAAGTLGRWKIDFLC
jgi:hypothetical protein